MKKQHLLLMPFLTLVMLFGITLKTDAQVPQQFNYQGAARNASGTPLVNKNLSLRLSIVDGSPNGEVQYTETRTVTTNTLGLYSVVIGSPGASSKTGTIAGVSWASGLKYIRVEVDPNNGSNFSIAGTAQLLSVPYALYAANGPTSVPETITTLIDNKNGTYSYKSENNTVTLINVPAAVKANFQDILNDNAVKTAITQLVNQNAGNVSYDVTNQRFTYKDNNGAVQTVNLTQLIKSNETITTLTDNQDGTYSYKSENNTITLINVPAAVKANFQNILNDNNVKMAITQLVNQNAGNLSYDVTNQSFTYKDANGNIQAVNLSQLVKAAETTTTLIDNGNGTYTYNNEKGAATIINVGASVKNNFQDILNDQTVRNLLTQLINQNAGNVTYDLASKSFTFKDINGNPQVIDLTALVKSSETLTTLTKDATTSVYTYKNEAGTDVNIDVIGDVKNNFSDIINNPAVKTLLETMVTNTKGTVTFNATNNQFSYTDATGNPQVIDLAALVKSTETLTTLTKDATTSIYTYKNEAGTDVNIDVIGDVKNNFSDIINNPAVKTLLETMVTNTKGTVTFNATNNQFSYTDATGNPQVIDLTALVKSSETLTTLTKDATTSVYTYKNEAGTDVNIDVIGDVKNNFSDIINNPAVKTLLETMVTNTKGTVTFNATNNQFSYTDATGNPQVIDLAAMVKSSETLTTISYDNLTNNLSFTGENGTPTLINLNEGSMSYDSGTNTLTYKDASGSTTPIALNNTDLSYDATAKVLTYKNTFGADQTINFATLIKDNETQTSLTDVVTQGTDGIGQTFDIHTLTYTDEKGIAHPINLATLIKGVETLTTLNYDGATHSLNYKDEKGAITTFNMIDLIGETQTLTKLAVNTSTGTLDYTDENKVLNSLDISQAVREPWYNNSTNTGATANTDDIYTKGWVGIGYTLPSTDNPNEKLRVNGSISSVNGSYADYVFEDYFKGKSTIKNDYKFKSLAEVDNFIRTYKHLPGITPITKLEKTDKGYAFNLSALSIQLLEKTEELYLHVIEQQKQLDKKNKEIDDLKLRLEKLESLLIKK